MEASSLNGGPCMLYKYPYLAILYLQHSKWMYAPNLASKSNIRDTHPPPTCECMVYDIFDGKNIVL